MVFRFLGCLLLSVISLPVFASEKPAPIVVELFTSQGCYSCPPADAFLGELGEQPNVVALACHVTYWNYLGWKDTYSRSFCDKRQRAYQSSLRGYAGVYTPQMVVNGRYGHIGSQKAKVNTLIDIAKRQSPLRQIDVKRQTDEFIIQLPKMLADKPQEIFLLGTGATHTLPISRGENAGKRLSYHYPVEQVISLGRWDGRAKAITKSVQDNTVQQWVVISQDWPAGAIRAVGQYTIHSP